MYSAYQELSFDLMNTLRLICVLFSQWYIETAPDIDMNVFDAGFFSAAQWLLSIVAVGVIGGPKVSGMTLGSRIQSYVTSLSQQYTAARAHYEFAEYYTDSAVEQLRQMNLTPVIDSITEQDENGEMEYQWVSITFAGILQITIEKYPYNSTFTIKVLCKVQLAEAIRNCFFTDSEEILNQYPNAFGDNYDPTERKEYDLDMDALCRACETAHKICDNEELVPYGLQSYKIVDHITNLNSELSSETTERYCTSSTQLAPYAQIMDNIADAYTWSQLDKIQAESIEAEYRWTYP